MSIEDITKMRINDCIDQMIQDNCRKRKMVWVLRITDPVEHRKITSVYSDFYIAQKYMVRDIYETAGKYNIEIPVVLHNGLSKVKYNDFKWEIEKCDFVNYIDF